MDIALRIVHIALGIFWAGTVIFTTFILFPQLKKLGPAIEHPVMKAIMRVTSPTMMVCSVVVLGTGITMVLRAQLPVSVFFSTGWGISMFIAFIAIVIVLIVGFGILAPSGARMEKLGRSFEGRQPTAEETEGMGRLTRRIATADRFNFVFIVIVTIAMPLSRFV